MSKKLLLCFLLSITSFVLSTAQEKGTDRANERYDSYSFRPAIDIYKKVIDKGYVSSELLKRLGNSYYFNAKYEEAAQVYERLNEEYSEEITSDYIFRYAQSLKTLGKYEDSDKLMMKFREMTASDGRFV